MPRLGRSPFIGALLACLVAAPLALSSAPAAQGLGPAATSGDSSETAAGSCWEIKQRRPTAADGDYWLLTPQMAEPARFYCDMTTAGGGWVLVGKGRNGWTRDYDGQGAAAELLSPDTAPMSSATAQLGARTVDALLDGGRVDALADGVRLRRAQDVAGAGWQESRVRFTRFGHWAWTFGARRDLASWSFGDQSGSGGTSPSYGSDEGYRRVTNTPSRANRFKRGFAFGTSVLGSSSPTSFLWSTTGAGGALPYTQVFLRPRVLSTDAGFTRIPNRGAAGHRQGRILRSVAMTSPWGVSGRAGNTAREGNVEVQAFTQSGRTMYVGGNFEFVQRDAAGTGRVRHPFLAAFDVATGERVRRFRPRLDEQVHALATLPNGSVVAGGEFTRANGHAATGIVALNPRTGATARGFHVRLANGLGALRVRAITRSGAYLYIGGAVTRFTGGPRSRSARSQGLGRVLVNGTPGTHWTPRLNGSVRGVSVSPDGTRVYAVGYFSKAGTRPAHRAAALRTAGSGRLTRPVWRPTWSSDNDYQQAVDAVGSKVWVGGSEHSLFQFSARTLARTMGDIFNPHGDIQAIADSGGVVYAGCHCNDYAYHDAYTYPQLSPGWTQADVMGWFGAWRASTGRRLPAFTPDMTMRSGSGIWAIDADSRGVVWAGGDVLTARTSASSRGFAGGFARFAPDDSIAPTKPTGLRVRSRSATRATLAWRRSRDAGRIHYVLLRGDRPVAATRRNTTSLSVPLGSGNRFYVRAVDGAGNYSASTRVLRVTG